MKVTGTMNGFNPIKIEIIIETEDELFDLYHRVNLSADSIERAYIHLASASKVPFPMKKTCSPLWDILSKEVFKVRGVK